MTLKILVLCITQNGIYWNQYRPKQNICYQWWPSTDGSLTTSITENLKSFIDTKLDEALNKMTQSIATLVANDVTLQKQWQEVEDLKIENVWLSRKVQNLESKHDKLKSKIDVMEKKSWSLPNHMWHTRKCKW